MSRFIGWWEYFPKARSRFGCTNAWKFLKMSLFRHLGTRIHIPATLLYRWVIYTFSTINCGTTIWRFSPFFCSQTMHRTRSLLQRNCREKRKIPKSWRHMADEFSTATESATLAVIFWESRRIAGDSNIFSHVRERFRPDTSHIFMKNQQRCDKKYESGDNLFICVSKMRILIVFHWEISDTRCAFVLSIQKNHIKIFVPKYMWVAYWMWDLPCLWIQSSIENFFIFKHFRIISEKFTCSAQFPVDHTIYARES